jgi:hypothetical protein
MPQVYRGSIFAKIGLSMHRDSSSGRRSFSEELEWLALQHQSVEIIFRTSNGARCVIRERILSLSSQDGEPCLKTASGLSIKLASLEEVNGRQAPQAC